MRFDKLLGRHARPALQRVDVLGEAFVKEPLARDERDEGVRDGRSVVVGIERFGKGVEGLRVRAEVGDVEDGFLFAHAA